MQRSYRLPLKPCRCADPDDNFYAHVHQAGADADDHVNADADSCIDVAQVREELAKSDQREVDSGTEISGNS